eukprot:1687781-Lingulodinium_polyedra.AAC.1
MQRPRATLQLAPMHNTSTPHGYLKQRKARDPVQQRGKYTLQAMRHRNSMTTALLCLMPT